MKYAFGSFVLDADEFRLTRDGETIPLSPKPFDLLVTLVAHAGQLVSREDLLRRVWKDVAVEQSSLNAAMSVLRQALGEHAASLIETVPGRGYRFLGELCDVEKPATIAPSTSGPTSRVVVVDDHAVVRLGVRTLLAQHPRYQVVGEAASASEAGPLTTTAQPDLMILDLMIDGEASLAHIAYYQAAAPGLRIVVLSMHDEDQWARRALAAGAHGYVMKGEMLTELAAAIDAVMSGGIWVSARISRSIVQDYIAGKPLSR